MSTTPDSTQSLVRHTRGPWEARPKRGDTDSWWVTARPPRPGHRGFVAECVARGSTENEANAHLIAAAPEMYEALQLAQTWLANCMPIVDLDAPKPLPVIAAALLKAQGDPQ